MDLAEDYVGRNNKKGQRKAVRLDDSHELTPTELVRIATAVRDASSRASGTFYILFKIYPLY